MIGHISYLIILPSKYIQYHRWLYCVSINYNLGNREPFLIMEIGNVLFFQYFDPTTWRREVKYLTLQYDDLAEDIPVTHEEAKLMEAVKVIFDLKSVSRNFWILFT